MRAWRPPSTIATHNGRGRRATVAKRYAHPHWTSNYQDDDAVPPVAAWSNEDTQSLSGLW